MRIALSAILALFCALAPVLGAGMPRVAFQRAGLRDAPANIVVMDLDGGRPADLPEHARAPLPRTTPALSPDGKTLLFAAPDGGSLKLFLWALGDDHVATGAPRRLTSDRDVTERFPAWSPDGTRVAYLATDAAGATWLRVAGIDGRNAQSVCRAGYEAPPSWNPNGQYLLFIDTEAGAPVLKEVPLAGDVRVALPVRRELRIVAAAYAPDGQRIAALAQRGDDLLDLWILPPFGLGGTRVVTEIAGAKSLLWPDDDRLVFNAAKVGGRGDGAIWRVAPTGRGLAAAPGYASARLISYVAMRQAPTAAPSMTDTPPIDGHITSLPMPAPPRPRQPRLIPLPPTPPAPPLPAAPALLVAAPLTIDLPRASAPTAIALVATPATFASAGEARPPVSPTDPPRTGPAVVRRPVIDAEVHGVVPIEVAVAPEVASVVLRIAGQFVAVLPAGGAPTVTYAWDSQQLPPVDPARGLPASYSAWRRVPDGTCTIAVQGLDAEGRPVGRDVVSVTVRNDIAGPPAELLRYASTGDAPTAQQYAIRGEGRVSGTPGAGMAGLNAAVDAVLVRAMVDDRTARYTLKPGTGVLTVGAARTALPENDVTSLYTEPEAGAIALARTTYAQWLLPLAHLRGPLPPPGGDGVSWQSPVAVVADVLGRDLTWMSGTHTVEGIEWLGDRRAVRLRTVLQPTDPMSLATAAVRMPPGMRPTQPAGGLPVRSVRGLRLTWVDETRRIPLRVEDVFLYEFAGTQATYVVRYTYRLAEG